MLSGLLQAASFLPKPRPLCALSPKVWLSSRPDVLESLQCYLDGRNDNHTKGEAWPLPLLASLPLAVKPRPGHSWRAAPETTPDQLLPCQDPAASKTDWTPPCGTCLTGTPHSLQLCPQPPGSPNPQRSRKPHPQTYVTEN